MRAGSAGSEAAGLDALNDARICGVGAGPAGAEDCWGGWAVAIGIRPVGALSAAMLPLGERALNGSVAAGCECGMSLVASGTEEEVGRAELCLTSPASLLRVPDDEVRRVSAPKITVGAVAGSLTDAAAAAAAVTATGDSASADTKAESEADCGGLSADASWYSLDR